MFEAPATSPDEPVDVWLADIDAFWSAHGEALGTVLSADEVARAASFRFDRDRRRFVARRAVLRTLLAQTSGSEPGRLAFDYGSWGKPRLEQDPRLGFSASHSGGLAAIAVARGAEVGIDVERVRDDVDVDGLARRFFAPAEVEELSALHGGARTRAFFVCWTRKEAFVKAIGKGLSYPLDAFAVSLAEGEEPLLAVNGDPEASTRWTLHALDAGPGYAGALVVSGGRPAGLPRRLDPASFPG